MSAAATTAVAPAARQRLYNICMDEPVDYAAVADAAWIGLPSFTLPDFASPGTWGVIAMFLPVVLVLIAAAIFAPWIAPYGSDQMGAGMALLPPNIDHWFGTDEFGRDIFSRVVYGARLTIQVGVIAVGISLTVGTLMGLVAGYARGWIERVLMRLVDVVFSFTETLIALAAVADHRLYPEEGRNARTTGHRRDLMQRG